MKVDRKGLGKAAKITNSVKKLKYRIFVETNKLYASSTRLSSLDIQQSPLLWFEVKSAKSRRILDTTHAWLHEDFLRQKR